MFAIQMLSGMEMNNCSHRANGKNCPISKTPCPGERIYAGIPDDISLGIIGMDLGAQVFFRNKFVTDIFKDTITPIRPSASCLCRIPHST